MLLEWSNDKDCSNEWERCMRLEYVYDQQCVTCMYRVVGIEHYYV